MSPRLYLAAALGSPLAILLLVGFGIPIGIFLVYSVFEFDLHQVKSTFVLDNYSTVLGNSVYRSFAINTGIIAGATAALSVITGYAMAYYLAFVAKRSRTLILALVVISMLASYLARIYAWRTLTGEHGVINAALEGVGLIDEPLGLLLFSRLAAIVAEVNLLMPLATLIIYASLAGIPGNLAEAARDLGAPRLEAFRRVTLPMSGRALLAALLFTFFLSAGDFITPVLLGGKASTTFGVVISNQLRVTGDYPLGSALSFVMLAAFALVYLFLRGSFKVSGLLPRNVS